jgi:hypothetical protein
MAGQKNHKILDTEITCIFDYVSAGSTITNVRLCSSVV